MNNHDIKTQRSNLFFVSCSIIIISQDYRRF